MRSLTLCTALALLSCGGEAPAPAPDAAAPADAGAGDSGPRDTLVVGSQSDIGNLLSVVYESAADSWILSGLVYPLVDNDFDCSLKKLPGIAKSWEWSEDGKVISMTLRDDLTWEDGTRVTTDDIAFTHELIGDAAVASPRVSYIERMTADGRPKVIDATHIEWHFTEAYDRDTQMSHAAFPLVPKHKLADADRGTLRGHPINKAPLSYGPFRLAKWEPNSRIVLEPNPKFTGPADEQAKLKRVIFRIIPEYSTRLIELESGKTDMMMQVSVDDADKLRREHPEIRLVRRGWRSQDYVAWNLTNPLFKDVRVRKALALAVDIDAMIKNLLTSETGESYAKRSIGTVTPALCGVHNSDVVPLPHDVDQARAMLAEAGWTDTDGDGILDKGGEKFAFTLTTNTGNPRRADIQIRVQAQLKDVGVEVNLEQTESNTFFERLRKKDYEAAISGWSAGLFVDPTTLWHCDTAERKYEFNFTGYCNPNVDSLMQRGLGTPDPNDSAPIWKEVQARIYEEQPYLFLWWLDEIVAVHERFENTTINVLSPMGRLNQWEVAPENVKYKR